jgi:hypothetical protein
MSHSYNHRVKPQTFQVFDLVLKENPCNQQDREKKGKFEPNCLGPFVIISTYGFGAYQLSTTKGDLFDELIIRNHLNNFYF